MNCKNFREVVDSYLSDELLTETNHDMIRHMENCGECRDLISARREIRSRLKTAVLASPEYRLSDGFDHVLMTRLRHESGGNRQSASWSWFGMRSFAVAASLLVVAMFGFVFLTNINRPSQSAYLVKGFAEDSLVNIAAGDHQQCAIEHDLEERPVSLAKADPGYEGLERLVREGLKDSLSDHKLVEAHACKYKDVQFAHLVMEGPSNTLSVLVAPNDYNDRDLNERVSEFSSEIYEVSSFDVKRNTVFVISGLEKAKNRRAAESLAKPLRKHFASPPLNQTALKFSYETVRGP